MKRAMIVGGISSSGTTPDVEIVNFGQSHNGDPCTKPADFPTEIRNAAGTFIGSGEDSGVIVCGGKDPDGHTDKCLKYRFVDDSWDEGQPSITLSKPRSWAASVWKDSKKWMLLGGWAGGVLSDSDLVDVGSNSVSSGAISLEVAVADYCIVKIDASLAFVAGGIDGTAERKEAAMLSLSNNQWTELPPMETARRTHTCGLIRSGGNGSLDTFYVVVAGGANSGQYLDSVEYFSLLTRTWRSGPNLPTPLAGHRMMQVDDSRLIIVGGSDSNGGSVFDSVFELDVESLEWAEVSGSVLATERRHHVMIPISNKIDVGCNMMECTLNARNRQVMMKSCFDCIIYRLRPASSSSAIEALHWLEQRHLQVHYCKVSIIVWPRRKSRHFCQVSLG